MAAWAVIRAFLVAPLMTNTIGLCALSTMSIVRPTASRSSGDGRVGISTKSASLTTALIRLVPLHRGFDCLGVSGIERGQVGAVYLDGDAPSCAGAA